MKKYRKKLYCLGIAFVAAVILTGSMIRIQSVQAKVRDTQEGLAQEVFRFHVLANSDSEEDQELKLKVRDAVIAYMKESIPESDSASDTKKWAKQHLDAIEQTAEKVIREQGYSYPAKAEVAWCEFPDKTYGDIEFPAGRYEALRIKIGEARGHNWWCVLYPNLCFVDSVHAVVPEEGKEELKNILSEEEYEMVTATSEFKIKWFFACKDK